MHVYLRHPVVSPAAIARMDAMLEVLDSAGFAKARHERAYGAIHTYTVGFAALEASRGESAGGDDDRADDVARKLARRPRPRSSRSGLQLLLDGISSEAKP